MEDHEDAMLEIPDLFDRAQAFGMDTHHLPIRDVSVPRPGQATETLALSDRVIADLRAGKTVVAHCRGGLGRSGLIAAAILTRLGHDGDKVIAKVREAREGAIETKEQEDWVRDFARKPSAPTKRERYLGSMLGLAAGDALGTTVEFKPHGTLEPMTDLVGGGPFGLEAGQWTDDTSMALCLAESLIEQQRFDPEDQM